MSAELFLDAMGKINDTYLADYADLKTAYLIRKRRQIRIFSSAAAACVGILLLAGAAVMIYSGQAKRQTADGEQKPPQGTVYVTEPPKEPTTPVPVPTESPAGQGTPLPTQPPVSGNVPEIHTQPPVLPETEAPTRETELPPEKDRRSEWTYFIAHLDAEQGGGVTSSPGIGGHAASSPNGSNGYMDDAYFRENSMWQFTLEYQGAQYAARSSKLSKDDCGAYLQDMHLRIREIALTAYDFTVRVQVYRINQMPEDAALAIRTEDGKYYLMVNTAYQPDSFRDFAEDFQLTEKTDLLQIAFFNAQGEAKRIETADDAFLWDLLLETDMPLIDAGFFPSPPAVNISFSSDYYAFYDVSFSLYPEGYLYFSVLGNQLCFQVDSEKLTNALMEHIAQKNNGSAR